MENQKTIAIEELCVHYEIPISFVESLSEYDLIVISKGDTRCVPYQQIPQLERLIRLHFDLKVNMEGLDVVSNLLDRIEELQNEIVQLNNQLTFYKVE